jgi:hypothetical protein
VEVKAAEVGDIVCKLAQERFKSAALWRNLWTILLFAFGTILIVFFILSVILFLRQDWLPTALVTIGTIVEGAGIKWIAIRRAEAVKEEIEAYGEVGKVCKNTLVADNLTKKLMLFGQFH